MNLKAAWAWLVADDPVFKALCGRTVGYVGTLADGSLSIAQDVETTNVMIAMSV